MAHEEGLLTVPIWTALRPTDDRKGIRSLFITKSLGVTFRAGAKEIEIIAPLKLAQTAAV